MKKKILIIVTFLIAMIITSIASAYAANYLYNSNEVYYDNSESNITSSDVQGAIDELYTEATNYGSINTRVTNIENKLSDTTNITTGSSGYYSFPNGLMMQWGRVTTSKANDYVCCYTWAYPKSYNSGVQVFATVVDAYGHSSSGITLNVKTPIVTVDHADICAHSSSGMFAGNACPRINVFAIGY